MYTTPSMNTSQYMDKQIMDLTNSQSNNDFINLMNPHQDISGGTKGESIVPSYESHPIRPTGSSPPKSNIDSGHTTGARAWNSAEFKSKTASIRGYCHNNNNCFSSNFQARIMVLLTHLHRPNSLWIKI